MPGAERPDDDLRAAAGQIHAQAELRQPVELAAEGHRLPGQALPQHREELAYLGQRPARIGRAVPVIAPPPERTP
jgi:hypothetical protein